MMLIQNRQQQANRAQRPGTKSLQKLEKEWMLPQPHAASMSIVCVAGTKKPLWLHPSVVYYPL